VKEVPPTKDELIQAIDDLFYAAHQSALYAYWLLVSGPINAEMTRIGIPEASSAFSNGIIESSLLLIRKSAEFFKPKEPSDKPDNLHAYQYLPNFNGLWIVDRQTTYRELHKRVGHITVREARHGKMSWPLIDLTRSTIAQWIEFFKAVGQSPIFDGNPPAQKLVEMVSALDQIAAACDRLAQIRSS
jgi:hypothetical protein